MGYIFVRGEVGVVFSLDKRSAIPFSQEVPAF